MALGRLASGTNRAQAVAELTLDPPSSTGDLAGPPQLDDDYLTLSTVHSAKGGEWRVVHLIHAADGMFPSDLATGDAEGVEEERRLFYVALTRAREHLHIYAPLRYHHKARPAWADAHSYAQRTRFLPPSVDRLLDHRPVRAVPADTALPEPSVVSPPPWTGSCASVVRPAGLAQAQGDRAHRPLPPPGLSLQPHRGRVLGLG